MSLLQLLSLLLVLLFSLLLACLVGLLLIEALVVFLLLLLELLPFLILLLLELLLLLLVLLVRLRVPCVGSGGTLRGWKILGMNSGCGTSVALWMAVTFRPGHFSGRTSSTIGLRPIRRWVIRGSRLACSYDSCFEFACSGSRRNRRLALIY